MKLVTVNVHSISIPDAYYWPRFIIICIKFFHWWICYKLTFLCFSSVESAHSWSKSVFNEHIHWWWKKPSSPEFTKKLITFTFDSQLDVRLPEVSFLVNWGIFFGYLRCLFRLPEVSFWLTKNIGHFSSFKFFNSIKFYNW